MAGAKPAAKALRMAGVRVEDLLVQCFTSRAGPGELPGNVRETEYDIFWAQLSAGRESAASAVSYINEMLSRLWAALDTDTGGAAVPISSLLNSITFATLFLPVNFGDPKILKAIENWQKADKAKEYARKQPTINDVMRTLHLRADAAKAEAAYEALVGNVVSRCRAIYSANELQRQQDSSYLTIIGDDFDTPEGAMMYPYLQELAQSSPAHHALIMVECAKALGQVAGMKKSLGTKSADMLLLSDLFLARQMLAVRPVADEALLKRILTATQQCFMCPLPYGLVVKDMALTVRRELLSPGSEQRRLHAREGRVVALDLAGDGSEPYRPIFYFVSTEEANSNVYARMMQLSDIALFESKTEGAPLPLGVTPATKVALLASFLAARAGPSADDLAALQALSPQQVSQLYDQALAAADAVAPPETARERQAAAAKQMRASLAELRAANKSGVTVPLPPELKGGAAALPLPAIAHFAVPVRTGEYRLVTRDEAETEGVLFTPYARTPVMDTLEKVLARCAGERDKDKEREPAEARLVLMGSNELAHSVVCAYLALQQVKPSLFRNVTCRFYLLPTERNHIASFFARWDQWFFRHVFAPFRSRQFILPWMQLDADAVARKASSGSVGPPAKLLRQLVENYVREAEVTQQVFVYQCDCWFNAAGGGGGGGGGGKAREDQPDVCIPLLQRFEAGISVDAREYQKRKNLPPSTKLEEILRDKGFQFAPPELSITVTPADVYGDEMKPVENEPTQYNSVVLSTTPYFYARSERMDLPSPPSPLQRNMELVVIPTDATRVRQKARQKLLSEPRQHARAVNIVAAAADARFLVRVDNFNFGPFGRVLVRPLTLRDSKQHVAIPIQTFNVIDS